MSKTMTVGPKGQVVIPAEMRAELGLKPGDQVVLDLVEGEGAITLTARRERLRRLRGKYAGLEGSMAEELHNERREQAEAKDW
ncbi:MAG: AbrB/MazE/SpoVT family DNA-binding domain-containing protein [Thermaceae bacterium]|nr:AbrB/MazE/SpoVT family DNA-binding domain-containing protein [Thermaceae bacterium]